MIMEEPTVKFGFTAKQIISEGRITQNDINLIRSWLPGQKVPQLTDEQIVLFLLSCNNNQEATKTTIRAYYSVKNGSPDVFNNRKLDREDLQKAMEAGEFCVFPERTEDGCAVILYKFLDPNYSNWDMAAYLMLLFMTLDAAIYDNPPTGLIIIVDQKNMGLMHLMKVRPGLVKTFFQYVQEALPVRLKNIHVLNTVSFVDKVMAIIRPFAKKEVMELIHFHPRDLDMEWFYKTWLPKKHLPEDFGGELPPVSVLHERNIQKLTNMQDYFEAEEMQRRGISQQLFNI